MNTLPCANWYLPIINLKIEGRNNYGICNTEKYGIQLEAWVSFGEGRGDSFLPIKNQINWQKQVYTLQRVLS